MYCLKSMKNKKEMLTNVLRVIVNNPFKKSFYEKKIINISTVFSISHKSGVKIFLK